MIRYKFKSLLTGITFFLLSLILLNMLYSVLVNMKIREEKNRYQYIAINQGNYIASCIDKVVVRTYTIREMLNASNGSTDFFEKVVNPIFLSIKNDTGINLRNIAVAPDGIVEKVFPLKNNEALLNFNFTDATKPGNLEAIEAYKKEKTIITNPFPLTQGGTGMAARTPVFIDNDDQHSYWGLVTATMDFDDVLNFFNFESFSKMHIKYRLWYQTEDDKMIVLDENFNADNKTRIKKMDVITENINLFNLQWKLDLIPENGWVDTNILILSRFVIVGISLLLTVLLLLVIRIRHDSNLMRTLAEQDNLTHCYSRHYLNSAILNVHDGKWKHPQNNYTLAIVDVDKFKYINDTYGHNAGDRALIAIADILKASISNPKNDKVVRFGGDEFLIFYSNLERKDLRIRFQDILSAVEKIHFDDLPELKVTISAGIAAPYTTEDTSYNTMIKTADKKLYEAKESGRNNYSL